MSRLQEVMGNPVEGLNREIKAWIDPATPTGRIKLVRAIFALRNRNGGDLLIGFDDKTLRPVPRPAKLEVTQAFSIDAIQTILFKHASVTFEVEVSFVQFEGQTHPAISVPPGVEVPVVCKNDYLDGERILIRKGDLYFRTLNESGAPASAVINARDWPALMQICHDNRDANIGRFLRRHLGGPQIERLRDVAAEVASSQSLAVQAAAVVKRGDAGFAAAVAHRRLSPKHTAFLDGLAMTIGVAIEPSRSTALPTRPWLNKVLGANPQLTGWPMWLDSSSFNDGADRPETRDGAWQAFVFSVDVAWSDHVDFWQLDPKGAFYLHRLMQDDLTDKVAKGSSLDVVLMLYRVAEAMVVATAMARSGGWDEESRLGLSFRWTSLSGRRLAPWVNRLSSIGAFETSQSNDAQARAFVEVPLDTPQAALAPYVQTAVAPLFAAFGGYEVPAEVVEEAVRKLLERKMSD